MFKAAKEVKDAHLAAELGRLAYWMIDLALPYRTMNDPFAIRGNPRFCTQYNNSETGENIGPMLSGTASWLNLSLLAAFGVEHTVEGLKIDPILREKETTLTLTLNPGKTSYKIRIEKPPGFYRMKDRRADLMLDHYRLNSDLIPVCADSAEHLVEVYFRP
ncbi:MAG: hypothetical protein ACM3ZC_14590 [Bacteroidota bacterium]